MKLFKKKPSPKHYDVVVTKDRILREVFSLEEAETILEILKQEGLYDKYIVETSINSRENRILEHKFLRPLIHSSEYTTSMAYDVTELGIRMALKLADRGIYSYDMLPHNFTFYNGEWVLYDFGALEMVPYNIKTHVRNAFRISFANFELLKLLKREELKHYFLNRINNKYMMKILPLPVYIKLRAELSLSLIMLAFKAYKKAYSLLDYFCTQYKKELPRTIYSFDYSKEECILSRISNEIKSESKNVLCIGENSTKLALLKHIDFKNTIFGSYVDNYELCDSIYNYIRANKVTNIIPAVIYPLVNDDNIPQNIKYRALYDPFAQDRFCSDCVILDLDEIRDGHNLETLITNLSYFTQNTLIMKSEKAAKDEIIKEAEKNFDSVQVQTIDDENILIIAKIEKFQRKNPINYNYTNNNRTQESTLQAEKVLEIIKSKA